MIAVAIIGLLSAMAIPAWAYMTARAKQAEARGNLSAIYALEKGHYAEKDRYGTITEIGFVPEGTNRYSYCVGDPTLPGSCVASATDPFNTGAGAGGDAPESGDGGVIGSGDGGGGGGGGGKTPIDEGGGDDACGKCGGPGDPIADDDDDESDVGGTSGDDFGNPHATRTSFEADAYGRISDAPVQDKWLIDEQRTLLNYVRGY